MLVACLCAEWCGSCRDYRVVFDRLRAGFAAEADFVWVDIEDDSEVPGEIDIDDFPTLLIVADGAPRFFGPLMPHQQTAERLLREALDGGLPTLDDDKLVALAQRVRAFRRAD